MKEGSFTVQSIEHSLATLGQGMDRSTQTNNSSYTMKQRNNNTFIWAEVMGFWSFASYKKFTVKTKIHDLFKDMEFLKRKMIIKTNRKYMNRYVLKFIYLYGIPKLP